MAAPKKYKTNTLKTSSAKKSSARTTAKKRPTSRVGSTKLAKKSFFKPWMALPIIVVVALAGYAIVQFSQASVGVPMTYERGSCITTIPKGDGRTAVQCTQDKTANYKATNVRPGKYKVCYKVSAYKARWNVKIKDGGEYARSKSQNDATRPSCTYEITTSKGTIYSQLTTTSNGVQDIEVSRTQNWSGVYIHDVRLQSVSFSASPAPASAPQASAPKPTNSKCNTLVKFDMDRFKIVDGGRTRVAYRRDLVWRCDSKGQLTKATWGPYREVGRFPNPAYRPRCNPTTQVVRDKTCVDATVYAKQVYCPKIDGKQSKSYTIPYRGKNQYSCRVKVTNKSYYKYAAPISITCFNSSEYVPKVSSDKRRYCGRKT